MKRDAFVMWSGGKDCSLALHNFLKEASGTVSYLVHVAGSCSQGHKLPLHLLKAQSQAMGVPLIIRHINSSHEGFEPHLKSVIRSLKKEGVNAGIFGDIHLQEHRDWIERVCKEVELEAIFPLWGRRMRDLMDEFVDSGFRARVVAVKDERAPLHCLLGREVDQEFVRDIEAMEGVDLCGENGEYHTFVYDSPLYDKSIDF